MLDKIKNINPWILAILVALSIELLISALTTVFNFNLRQYFNELGYLFSLPALKISGYETVQAINDFSGEAQNAYSYNETVIISSLGVFTIFILGPYLLIKGYIQSEKSGDKNKRSWTWYIGAILIISTLFPAILSATVGSAVYLNTKESMLDSRQKDQMRMELMNLALDASYLIFLPQVKGGGDGSFNTIGPESETITLENLDSYHRASSKFEFQIHGTVNDSSFTIVGVTDRMGKNENFKNVNGETGKQQISAEVTPYRENIFKMDRNGTLKN